MSRRPVALLANPAAGRGRGRRAHQVALSGLTAAGYEVRDLVGTDGETSLALAREALDDPELAALVCVGGDGMVNLALQAQAAQLDRTGSSAVPVGLVPAGTGNDVARTLDITRDDPAAAVDRLVEALRAGRRRRLDLARCRPADTAADVPDSASDAAREGSTTTAGRTRYFATVLCAGFDAMVNERANSMTWPRGQARYQLAILAELRAFRALTYTLELDGQVRELSAMMVSVGNGPSFGGGLRITEGARLDDGLLDVVVIKPVSKPDLVRTYPRLFRGTHTTHPAYERTRVKRVRIASPGVVAYADGERIGPLPLDVEVVPQAWEVLV